MNYQDDPAYLNKKQACAFLGVYPATLTRYAERMGYPKVRSGRCSYYRREDIEELNMMLRGGIGDLIDKLQRMSGKKVFLT